MLVVFANLFKMYLFMRKIWGLTFLTFICKGQLSGFNADPTDLNTYILNHLPTSKINKCTLIDKRKQTEKTALWALDAIICIEKILTGLNRCGAGHNDVYACTNLIST